MWSSLCRRRAGSAARLSPHRSCGWSVRSPSAGLKRRLSDVVFRALLDDLAKRAGEAGPGGHSGATLQSSASGPTPAASSSDKSLPGPAEPHATLARDALPAPALQRGGPSPYGDADLPGRDRGCLPAIVRLYAEDELGSAREVVSDPIDGTYLRALQEIRATAGPASS